MKKLNEKDLKSINGGFAPVVWAGWATASLAGGALYDFAQGFVNGARDANNKRRK